MKVSLVATVKDAAPFIGEFLACLEAQTRPPDEVVIVDGGSTDGTAEILQQASRVTLLEEPGANIARGRNVGIRAAAHEVIAVSDADCILSPDWLEYLLVPIETGADVAKGFYRPIAEGFLQACVAAVCLPESDEVDPVRFMPSSRSIAFRREAFELVGGYPEWLDVGEDMYFNHRLREQGVRAEMALRAVAYWRIRPTLSATWRQYAGYARGDALGGMYPERHAIRFAAYVWALAALASRRPWALAVAATGGLFYAASRVRRVLRTFRGTGPVRLAATACVLPFMAFIDLARMAGYVSGLARWGDRGGRR